MLIVVSGEHPLPWLKWFVCCLLQCKCMQRMMQACQGQMTLVRSLVTKNISAHFETNRWPAKTKHSGCLSIKQMSQWALEQVWVGHNAFNAHVAMANNNATTSQGVVAPIDMADWEQMPFLMMIGGACIGLATSHPF